MNVPKLKQSFNIKYQIFQDGKTIVCYVTPMYCLSFLKFFIDITEERINAFEPIGLQFKGVARFKEGDKFDIEIGKKIAKKKAMRAYFQYLKRKYIPFFKKMLEIVNQRLAFMAQVDERIEILTNEIKELTK